MPVTIRVMNWNIQTFGVTKAGLTHNTYDVIRAIAKIVVDSGCDIFVMLEMATTRSDVARRLARDMLAELVRASLDDDEWQIAVLSPNTGREHYAFFIRDRAKTIPLPISHPVSPATGRPVLGLSGIVKLEDAIFTAPAADEDDVLGRWFPLIDPDLVKSHHYALWPGTRRPVLGMFYLPEAAPANRVLPIVACHYLPNSSRAQMQFRTLRYFRMLRGLTPETVPFETAPPAPATTRIRSATGTPQPRTLNYYVLTGDFNVNYVPGGAAYAPITGDYDNELDATGHIDENTHLVTYSRYSPRDFKDTESLAVSDYDNFFTRISQTTPAAATAGDPYVINVPELVRRREVRLRESVRFYAELDKRGFSTGGYPNIVNDFARQIAGDSSHIINIPGSLMGGRLISDHLPTLVDITVN